MRIARAASSPTSSSTPRPARATPIAAGHHRHRHHRLPDGRQEAEQHRDHRKGRQHGAGQARTPREEGLLHHRPRRARRSTARARRTTAPSSRARARQLHHRAAEPGDRARRCPTTPRRSSSPVRPTRSWPRKRTRCKAYLDGGGKLIAIVGPASKTDLNDLLQPYQVAFTGNVVVDPAKSVPQDPRVVVVDSYGTHAITTDLRDLTFFPLTTNITYPQRAAGGGTVTVAGPVVGSELGQSEPARSSSSSRPIPRGRWRWPSPSTPARPSSRSEPGAAPPTPTTNTPAPGADRLARPDLEQLAAAGAGQPDAVPQLRQLGGRAGQPDQRSRARHDAAHAGADRRRR